MNIFWGYVITFAWVFLILIVTNVLKSVCHMSDEGSRKLVHILVSFAWVSMYLFFGATWHLLVPPLTFVVLNYLSYKKDIFSAMERAQKDSASLGTVYYPISMVVLSILCLIDEAFLIPYGIGMFCMAFGDGLAPVFGQFQRGNIRFFSGRRSLYGSLAVFLLSLLVVIIMTAVFSLPLLWYQQLLLAFCAAVLEFVGLKGFDNLTLPIGTGVLAWLLITF